MEWAEASRSVMERRSEKLRRSGYPETVRHEIIKTACEKYDRMCEEENNGGRPIYLPRQWREKERRKDNKKKVKT